MKTEFYYEDKSHWIQQKPSRQFGTIKLNDKQLLELFENISEAVGRIMLRKEVKRDKKLYGAKTKK